MADDNTDDRKTLYFLQGLESRPGADAKYGKGAQQKVLKDAQDYAAKRNLNFKAIPHTTQQGQIAALEKQAKKGDVALGFSAGGYALARSKFPGEKIVVGAPRAKGNIETRGRHLEAVRNLTAPRQQQTRFPPQPPPVSTGVQGAANRAAGLDSVSYLARTATPAGTMSRQGGATAAISRLNPEFANRLASGIQALRANGYPNAGIASAFRTGSGSAGTGSRFDRAGQSLHSIGAAVDLAGIGGPGSRQAQNAHKILAQHGVYGVYGPNNRAEYNHFQLVPQKSVSALGGDPAKVRQFAGTHLPSDDQLHQLWGIADKRVARAPSFPQQPPAVKTGMQGAANRAAGVPTVEQLIAQNRGNPELASYLPYTNMIPDQKLPVDQWKQKHGDLYNSPMVPQAIKSIFDRSLTAPTPAAARGMPPPFPPMPPPRPTAAPQPGDIRGSTAAGWPSTIMAPGQPSGAVGMRGDQSGYMVPQPNWPQGPTPLPPQQQPQQPPIMAGPQMNMPQQPAPQPPNNIMMPPTAGAQPNNAQPIMAGPQMNMQPPPMSPQMQPGLSGGTPFNGMGGAPMGLSSASSFNPMTTDWALPSNRALAVGPGFGGGSSMGLSGGPGFGQGGGFGGGDAGMGGRGGGSKVNLQSAMNMIPKPTQPNVDISQLPQIQQTRVQPAIQPGQGGDMSLAESIMQLLQA